MKYLSLFLLALTMVGCSSTPTVFPEDKGVTCYQTEDQEKEKKHTCLRIPAFSDTTKWHRVRSWEVLPEIPDLP